ncbi:mitochondrial inner membrane protease subunit 2 [Caerostris darwini]|uniref:Mitochondrial inner membrane protease subunit 2 n=1 Tax=Caerostris darwini TaxID=1538125 RepID=A0AAV4RVV8_9ARAC|nr:mitochondrial inner membrane protease subunit 2 [Caerostris darwini]
MRTKTQNKQKTCLCLESRHELTRNRDFFSPLLKNPPLSFLRESSALLNEVLFLPDAFRRLKINPPLFPSPSLESTTWGIINERDGKKKKKKDLAQSIKLNPIFSTRNQGEGLGGGSPRDPDEKLIKRVIAVEGDTVKASDMLRYVSIPAGHCWVEGDHTAHSMDSNYFGPVSVGLIFAKASHIVWPPSRWRKLSSDTERRPVAWPLHSPHHSIP